MMRAFAYVSMVALSGAAFGQSGEALPAFEIADVRASAPSTNPNRYMTGGVLRGGRYDLRRATMLDLIRTAWGVDADTVLGGPNWLETDRFDVIAKAPATTSPETVRLMLQSLLADRFKLVLHKDTKPMPAFALTVGKSKVKLKEASGLGNVGCVFQPQNAAPGTVPTATVSCHGMTMEAFAQALHRMAGDYLTNPVVDLTGLKGSWDFDIKWNERQQLPQAGTDAISIFDAVDKQLGLKLELQKVAAPVIVVDNVNRKPTDNSPEVMQILPPSPPAEFEVADIKLSMPDTKPYGRIQRGGRLELRGFTLKMLIGFAWEIDPDAEGMIAGVPKAVDSTRFDILAKAATAVSGRPNDVQVDVDVLELMLRALLIDRFKLVTHYEDRPVSGYTLLSAKPRLTKADPTTRTGCKEAPTVAKDPRDSNPTRSRLVTCQNITMSQFAEQLQGFARGYIHNPVVDATGLDGAWDFTLSFSTAGFLQGSGRVGRGGDAGQPAADAPTASDPSGGLSLFDAVKTQLGLRLEMQKRPMPVLVIDHVEERPTDN